MMKTATLVMTAMVSLVVMPGMEIRLEEPSLDAVVVHAGGCDVVRFYEFPPFVSTHPECIGPPLALAATL